MLINVSKVANIPLFQAIVSPLAVVQSVIVDGITHNPLVLMPKAVAIISIGPHLSPHCRWEQCKQAKRRSR